MMNATQNGQSAVSETTRVIWPDLSKDARAWELAKTAAVEGEAITDLIARAQRIKETL